jgi:HAD superfamily hydrolase (TIGR01549 family)
MSYDGIVFDMDGVLLKPTGDTLIRAAVEETFSRHGIDQPAETDIEAIRYGSSLSVDELEAICARQGVDPGEFWRVREQLASEKQLETVRNGTKTLYDDIETLDSLDRRLGLVSNNQHRTVEGILSHYGIDRHFDVAYGRPPTREGLRYTKPSPYHLERIASALGTGNLLFVGDSTVDIEAANRAGLDSAFIRRPHRNGYDLAAEPTYRIDSLTDLRRIS